MKRLILQALCFLVPAFLAGNFAQAQQLHYLSAQQAAEMAVKNSRTLRNLDLDYKIQDSKNKEITGLALPQVTGNLDMRYNFKIPTTLLPDFISPSVYGVLEKEGVQDGNGNPITMPQGDPQFFPAQFGVPWTVSAGFTLSQILFQPDVFVGLQARSAALDYSKYARAAGEDQLKQDVYTAYYAIVIAEEQLRIIDSNELRIRHLVSDNEAMYKAGFVEKLDIDRANVTLNSILSGKSNLINFKQMGEATLKKVLNVPQKDSIVVTDKLDFSRLRAELADVGTFKYDDRNEIKQLNAAQELLTLDLKRYKLQYIPTVTAFWNYSQNAQRAEFNFLKTGINYPWFPTSIVGLGVKVNIFDGLQRENKIKQAQYELEKMGNTMDNTKQGIDLQIVMAKNTYINNLNTLEIQQKNVELAEKVYNTAKKKQEQGVGSSFEVIQTEIDLQNAQSKYFEALYQSTLARINYMRALGRL